MFSRTLIRATLRLSSRTNNNEGSYFESTALRGNNRTKDQKKNEDNTSDHLFDAKQNKTTNNNNNNNNTRNGNNKPYFNYRNHRRQTYRQPTEKATERIYKKGEFNPNILPFTWMST